MALPLSAKYSGFWASGPPEGGYPESLPQVDLPERGVGPMAQHRTEVLSTLGADSGLQPEHPLASLCRACQPGPGPRRG